MCNWEKITFAIITLCVIMATTANAQTNCINTRSKDFQGGSMHVCVVEEGNKMGICTEEKLNFPALSIQHHWRCTRGSLSADTYQTTKDGAQVYITSNPPSQKVAVRDFATRIGCVGFYTALVLQPETPAERINDLFTKLTNCHLTDTYQSKATERAKAGISLFADVLGAIPTPHTIVAGLVIKALLTAHSTMPDPKENDYIRFLTVHRTVAEIKVLCGSLAPATVKQCLSRQAGEQISGDGKYQFELTGCKGTAFTKADSYLILEAGSAKTTTKASAGFGSPLRDFCKGDKPDFMYTNVQVNKGKEFCITAMDADLGTDKVIGAKKCISSLTKKRNTLDWGNGMVLNFQFNK